MKRNLFILLCALTVCASCVLLIRWLARPSAEQMENVYTAVKSAKQFSAGGVGIANTRSQEEQAFRELLTQPEAVIRCRKLLTEGTPAGQMYGLLGLRLLDRKAFQAALPPYKNAKTGVTTVEGCLVMDNSFSNVVWQIEWIPPR